jgi:hypothetical protein
MELVTSSVAKINYIAMQNYEYLIQYEVNGNEDQLNDEWVRIWKEAVTKSPKY